MAGEYLASRADSSFTTCSLMLPKGGSRMPKVVIILGIWGGEEREGRRGMEEKNERGVQERLILREKEGGITQYCKYLRFSTK